MEAFAGPEKLQCESSVPVEGQYDSQKIASSPSVINEYKTANCHELSLSVYDPNVAANDIVNLRSDELVEVPVDVAELHHKHSLESGMQDMQSNNRGIGPSRSWEDGYNWRKYGQKHIKGNEFPRSYYKCSHPNCKVKKQVEQSHDGRITDVIYRGKHDHPKPQAISHISACTISSVQGERFNGLCTSKNSEDKSSNGNGQTSHHAKPNGVPELSKPYGTHELSLVLTTDNNVREGVQFSRMRDEVQDDGEDPESKRRCLNLSTDMTNDSGANHRQHKESLEAHQGRPRAFLSSSSNENLNVTVASHEMALPVTAPNPPTDMVITSSAIVPVEVDYGDSQQTKGADIGVQAIQTDHRGVCHSVTADRFLGDGYSWRKYGQKHIKGSEFPRSYYRCTHPNCQVKKQLECSHDGQIIDIVYKGEHNHPKSETNSHITVGRILSIQEDGFEQFSPLNQTHDKSLTGQTVHTQLNINPDPVQTSDTDVQGSGSKFNKTGDMVEHNTALDSKCDHLKVSKKTNEDVATGLNHQQCKPFVEVQGQCQSQALVSTPSAICKDTAVSSRESIPSIVSISPVYMVTSRGIVPVEVDTEDNRQRQSAGNGVEAEESNQNGLSLSMTERLLENAYHWRKYGQKNIKGSEFPRSYYRCTHPNCQVKMQLERSHDGRIIEIIYKGKHDHPKPQPITRMAIGAILSLEEDRSGKICEGSGDKLSKHVETSVCNNPNRITEHSHVEQSVENAKTAGEKLNRSFNEVEDDNDMESKRRKIEIGDMDLTPVIRTPREPRVVVETLSDFDVVDDGYRWQKYGRKIVKGNSNPRNYYRCSIAGCSVKKHVERAAKNPKAVITTYEGKHNHGLPPARITTHDTAGLVIKVNGSSDTVGVRSGEFVARDMDAGDVSRWSPEYRRHERDEIIDLEHIKITDPDTR